MDKALQTQLANIEKRTGKSLDALAAIVRTSGLTTHGEIRDMLKRDLGMGHGDANTLVHHVLKSDGTSAAQAAGPSSSEVLDEITTNQVVTQWAPSSATTSSPRRSSIACSITATP